MSDQWQPIETAPHEDAAEILGWDGTDRAVYYFWNFRWRVHGDTDNYYGQPTHWAPLPPEPVQ